MGEHDHMIGEVIDKDTILQLRSVLENLGYSLRMEWTEGEDLSWAEWETIVKGDDVVSITVDHSKKSCVIELSE